MRLMIYLLVPFLFLYCLGCEFKEADPTTVPWKEVRMDYCVGLPPNVELRTWKTDDPGVIKELDAAFVVTERVSLTAFGTMSTNKMTLTLADNEAIVMYIYEDDMMGYHSAEDNTLCYSITVQKRFAKVLKETIEEATGEVIHFYYDQEVTIVHGEE